MKDKFNMFMENNKKFIENINLVGSIFNKFVFSMAIAVVTIFISIAANDISKTSNDIAKASNSISKQNLELSKQQTPPSLEFDIIEEDGINKYKITSTKGIIKDFNARLDIVIKIRSQTTHKIFVDRLVSNSIQNETNKSWIIDGENINLDLNKYTDDIKSILSDEIANDNFSVMDDKIIEISYRDFNNNYGTEYYTVKGNKIEYDNNLTSNNGHYSWDNFSASTLDFLTKDMENRNDSDKYKKNIKNVVDLIKQFN